MIDVGLSVLAYKSLGRRIDIDAEDTIYHLKVREQLGAWGKGVGWSWGGG